MSHEQRPGHEPNPINTQSLVDYAEQCFGASVDVANFKYPSVSLLKDLEPLAIRYPADYLDDSRVLDATQPVQAIVALIVESDSLAYAVIKIDYDNTGSQNTTEDDYKIVKIQGKQQTGDVVDCDSPSSPWIENGALIVRPQGNYDQSFVYTNPRPDTQTSEKMQHHILARHKTAESDKYKENRKTYLIKGALAEEDIEVGAPSESMAKTHANILRNYGLWVY